MGPGSPSTTSMVVRSATVTAAETSSTVWAPAVAATSSSSASAMATSLAGAAFVVGGAVVGWAFAVVVGVVFLSVVFHFLALAFVGSLVMGRGTSMRKVLGTPGETPAPWSWRWWPAMMVVVFTMLAVGLAFGMVLGALLETSNKVPEGSRMIHVGN